MKTQHILWVVVLALAFTVTAQGVDFGGFAPVQDYYCGNNSRDVAVGDYNGDGVLDLAGVSTITDDVAVLLGNGDGTFAAGVSYFTGNGNRSICADDLDGDGDLDFSVLCINDYALVVLKGNGDGTFYYFGSYTFDPYYDVGALMKHTTADLDGDGDIDMAVMGLTYSYIRGLWNDGNGIMGDMTYIAPCEDWGTNVKAADVDNDGDMDIMSVGLSTMLRVALNNGDGTVWTHLPAYMTNGTGIVSPPSDFNGDGILDLAMNYTTDPDGYLVVTFGNGDGTFGTLRTYYVDNPWPPTAADLNNDGALDLIVPQIGSSYESIAVMVGSPDGTFADPVYFATVGNNSQNPDVGDFDGDGWLDVVSTSRSGDCVNVFINLTEELAPVSAELACTPSSGTIPFDVLLEVTMINGETSPYRRFAGRVDLNLAGGQYYSNYRAGFTNMGPESVKVFSWIQNLDMSSMLGVNSATLFVEDVTPAPYNQPPYSPAGETDTDACTVTGIAP